jgi:meso-butanediol dehydrogenase/(S,S)-butanediol dehydrogenase/diacetyl reductase
MQPGNDAISGLLTGQTAIVTGAARGIGRAIAVYLAEAGADVAVSDLDATGMEQTASDIAELGRRSIAIRTDVSREEERRALIDQTEEALGPIDVLVNNAGIMHVVDLFAVSEADWDRVMDVNAKAVFFMSQAVLPGMMARGRGTIVNIASIAGKTSNQPRCVAYNVSKAAVISMTRTLAVAAAPSGVRVNCVCPGMIGTDMWQHFDRDLGQSLLGLEPGALIARELATIPLGRAGTPQDVARVVLFLASSLGDYMTGQAVNVSGGMVMF